MLIKSDLTASIYRCLYPSILLLHLLIATLTYSIYFRQSIVSHLSIPSAFLIPNPQSQKPSPHPYFIPFLPTVLNLL